MRPGFLLGMKLQVFADGLTPFELVRQIREPPSREALVGPAAIAFGAALHEQLDRRAPVERRKREVERAPIPILAIDIRPQLRKRRRNQPFAARTSEIGNRGRDVGNDRCTRQSRHRIASARGKASRVMSATR